MTDISVPNWLWFMKDDRSYLGEDRIALMTSIIEHRSISATTRSINISYKKARKYVDAMNSLSDNPLVIRTTGGSGTIVTESEREAIQLYEQINQHCNKFLEEELKTTSE